VSHELAKRGMISPDSGSMGTSVSYTLSMSAAGIAAPPVVVKSNEVAAEVIAMVIAAAAESCGLTTAVWPAAHPVKTVAVISAQAGRCRSRRRLLVGDLI